MSDPRFARLKTDPRFRRPRKKQSKVVVDDRFKEIFEDGKKKKGKKGKDAGPRVDKYGRPVSETQETDNLRRFYRLENEEDPEELEPPLDYARGGVTLESSDEEEDNKDDDSEDDGEVTFGLDHSRPIPVPRDDDDAEIDLDETEFADLDAQAAAYNKDVPQETVEETDRTNRIAVVNLDWDHVRAIHLYRIFSSLVSPTAPAIASTSAKVHPDRERSVKGGPSAVTRGKVLSVRVYPSEFGKERLAREETEGPPPEIFKRAREVEDEDEVNEKNIYEVGDGEEYDEDALRKYQLERLRYYYAIVTCDTVEAASHIYSELEGTELERSANVFDLSFVPDGMSFDSDCRDEVTEDVHSANYKAIDFVTDALRHSKVKLTWDEDDPERNHITRRTLTKEEMENADFRAYLASSGSESESDAPTSQDKAKKKKAASRDKLRSLLLSGGDDELPEGWGGDRDGDDGDVDMEITFTPGLSASKVDKEETTLEKYERKLKEKRKKRKEELKGKGVEKETPAKGDDDFFAEASDDVSDEEETAEHSRKGKETKKSRKGDRHASPEAPRTLSTPEELALLATSDNPNAEPKHFNLKAVLKAEKKRNRKGKRGKKDKADDDQELQEDFSIDVKDDRFKAVHEDHSFAIDPSNPHFKKTKSMAALLEERSKRHKDSRGAGVDEDVRRSADVGGERSLQSLVESVKRKSMAADQKGTGKRRKI
ncbi:hypothetical protein PLICRDRAFT_171458 [Plicaturopsis crispa FD-325 SS-3]|nr:hypothetical protein PLICRDRAFT_171458 [Plicaturopsis crispa FD-325 SS-3]